MSSINPLSIELIRDNDPNQYTDLNAGCETVANVPDNKGKTKGNCSLNEGPKSPNNRFKTGLRSKETTRPTATQLRANPDLLAEVEKGRKQYAKGSKENRFERAAHGLRNDESNERNNLAKRLQKSTAIVEGQTLPLFAPKEVIRLTPDQRAALDYWQGTGREIGF